MSSNPNNYETRRMTSITRRIHSLWVREKLKRIFFEDMIIAVIMQVIFVISNAYHSYGEKFISHYGDRLNEYTVSRDRDELYAVLAELFNTGSMRLYYRYMAIAMAAIVIVQLIGLLIEYPFDNKKIRKILRPINEIALKADELSRMTFDDNKYRIIEDAISNLEPGEDEKLSFNNSDLQGIEAAMNNLLSRMRASYRQQARFVNDASHELRTPIAVIEGYASMLERWGKDDEKVLEESITAISHEAEHMKHLVEQLLFLARGDSGKTLIDLKDVSLNDMMREIYEESLMIDEDHPYRFKASDEDLRLQADEGLLKQAVRILVDNAAKYTNKGDEISLSTGRTDEGRPYLRVQDTGIGMADADIEHMFERFYRADEARNTEGTGLGLSIAKWIVDKHKGHFEITSVTELGTRISIVL
ncbi:MAG: HAMP domain-containing histidine kinase [Lachnospiraceae bacterium]|nr:HAMP domain-containing histidine kinase [Lachnospiraceae bacterium]